MDFNTLKDGLKLLKPLSKKDQFNLAKLAPYIDKEEYILINKLLKQNKAEITNVKKDISFMLSGRNILPQLSSKDYEIKEINKRINKQFYAELFKDFSNRAWQVLPHFIASNVIGLNNAKKAALLQLFSKEKLHILLLGDPGTGKTEILRSTNDLAPIASFGLGSGTSSAGLSVTVKGKSILPGLLPLANNGISCIDELNLMAKSERGSMYNAMEKGFVTYDKGGNHYKFDANIRVLATANPKKDKFENYSKSQIIKQLPFDSALLSRFHLIFIVKKADSDAFANIAEKIISGEQDKIKSGDIELIKEYIILANKQEVEIPKHLMSTIKRYVVSLKKQENDLPYEITPRMVHGIIELIKASARLELRTKADNKDLLRVFKIIDGSLAF